MSNAYAYWYKGTVAFKEGKEFWECPYCSSNDDVQAFPAWLAGWCWQKQEKKNDKT